MGNSLLHNKGILAVILIVVVGGAWYGLTSSTTPTPVLSSTGVDTTGDDSIVRSLLALQAITLSGTIFSDPAYATLKDFTTAIVPVPAGRTDPFAPLPSLAVPVTSTAINSAKIFLPVKQK
jgi:hypothetical protein